MLEATRVVYLRVIWFCYIVSAKSRLDSPVWVCYISQRRSDSKCGGLVCGDIVKIGSVDMRYTSSVNHETERKYLWPRAKCTPALIMAKQVLGN